MKLYWCEKVKRTKTCPKNLLHLVVLIDERLPGCNGGSTVHFVIGVAVFFHKHLQDLQHLCVWEKWLETEHREQD